MLPDHIMEKNIKKTVPYLIEELLFHLLYRYGIVGVRLRSVGDLMTSPRVARGRGDRKTHALPHPHRRLVGIAVILHIIQLQ